MAKTTAKHFEIFKTECLKWIYTFGLTDWEFHFKHADLENNNMAQCERNSNSHIAKLSLCKTWPTDTMINLTEENVRKAAFEEVCHVFLYRLSSNAYARFIMEHEINEAEHSIIRTLHRILMR